jgi:hypothetical protein
VLFVDHVIDHGNNEPLRYTNWIEKQGLRVFLKKMA